MKVGPSPTRLAACAAFFFGAGLWPAADWQSRLAPPLELHDLLREQADQALPFDPAADAFQKLSETSDEYDARYGFKNYNGDHIEVGIKVKKSDFAAYEAQWGYSTGQIDALKAWQKGAKQAALKEAEAKGQSQAELNAAVAQIGKQYRQKLRDYLGQRGFTLGDDNSVDVDMPALVRKNAPLVHPLVVDLDTFARKKRYDSSDLIASAAAMVQTAVFYRVPPPVVGDLHTGGLWPPIKTLVVGWGDCDTKSAALASILTNYSGAKVVGISVPDHYLLGVLGIPGKGDAYVEYQGAHYVLIEAAGPAWLPPGYVAQTTQNLLAGRDREGYKIEPFF